MYIYMEKERERKTERDRDRYMYNQFFSINMLESFGTFVTISENSQMNCVA